MQNHKAQLAEKAISQANEALGLQSDYPIDIVPIYEGVEILDTEKGSATSTDGEPMVKWYVHGQFEGSRKEVRDYYNDYLLDHGFRQTQTSSLPASDGSGANYGMDYGNEDYAVSLIIEKKSSDKISQLEITVYRVAE